MNRVDLTQEEVEQLTAAVRDGAAAIVRAWHILGEIGRRINRDWEPESGNAVCNIMDLFASNMRAKHDISTAEIKRVFSRSEDWH